MPNREIREPEQKHMISKKPVESLGIQEVSTQFSESPGERLEDAPKNAKRRRGRRKSKGAMVEDLPNGKLEVHVEPTSDKGIVFKRRPGYGQLGTKCVVKANYFLAELSKSDLCHYKVDITPEVNSSKLNKAVMAQLVKLHRETDLGARLPVYDGKRNLYTAGLLPFTSKEFRVILVDDCEGFQSTKENEFKVRIEFVGFARMDRLQELLSGKQVRAPQEALTVIDTVLKELAAKRHMSFGRLFYSPEIQRPHQLGGGLHSWRGFYQSVKPTQMGLTLNIDMSASAFIEPLPVVEFVAQILGKDVRLRPLSDADSIKTVHQNGYNQDPHAQEVRICIDEKLATVEARVLPAPWLKYNDTGKEKQHLPQLVQWNMINKIHEDVGSLFQFLVWFY